MIELILFYVLNLVLIWMKYEALIIDFIGVCMIFVGVVVFIVLLHIPAPYGRYSNPKWGYTLPVKFSWMVQECPSCILPSLMLLYRCIHGDDILPILYEEDISLSFVNIVGLMMFIIHYFQRSFIYPFLIKGGKPTPLIPFLLAFIFCTGNGYIQGRSLVRYHKFDQGHLHSPTALLGMAVFITGMLINLHSDHILRNLRKPGETGYKIPRGGLFEYVSAANLLGEIVEWTGYVLYCQNLASFAFAFFTWANLVPRALKHHSYYLEKFDDYPRGRKAVIPFLL